MVGWVLSDYCDYYYCYYCYFRWRDCDCSLGIYLDILSEVLTSDNASAKLPHQTSGIRAIQMAFPSLPCTHRYYHGPCRSEYGYSSYVAWCGTSLVLPQSGQMYNLGRGDKFRGDSDHDTDLFYTCYCELNVPVPAASDFRDAAQTLPGL